MRVIAGDAKGRRLSPVKGATVRPMTDQIRAALFSSLGERIRGAAVLDLYAGSGAIGVEAMSRGADHVTFVERDPAAVSTIKRNLEITGYTQKAEVKGLPVEEFLGRDKKRRFDLIVVDPPFATEPKILGDLTRWLNDTAGVVVRTASRSGQLDTLGTDLRIVRDRRYGDSTVWYLEKT